MLFAQLCPALCDAMDCSPPGSSVHGILQARILEWSAISFSRGSSQPRECYKAIYTNVIKLPIIKCWEQDFWTLQKQTKKVPTEQNNNPTLPGQGLHWAPQVRLGVKYTSWWDKNKGGAFDIKKAPELSYARNINILLINYLYVCFFIPRMIAKFIGYYKRKKKKKKSDVIRWIFPNN